jgi:anti-anti-sigma factor
VLDLADVEYLDSASLGALVREGMRLDAAGRRLVLARPQRVVERTLRLLGLQVKLPIFPTVAQARAAAVARRAAPEV